jgi:hypothetical protein
MKRELCASNPGIVCAKVTNSIVDVREPSPSLAGHASHFVIFDQSRERSCPLHAPKLLDKGAKEVAHFPDLASIANECLSGLIDL